MVPVSREQGTVRDCVFLHTSVFTVQLTIAVRSLRSCDQNCRIILFVHNRTRIQRSVETSITRSTVEIVHSQTSELEAEKDWLKRNGNTTDRVFRCDPHDTIFQGSPFSVLRTDELTVTSAVIGGGTKLYQEFLDARFENQTHKCSEFAGVVECGKGKYEFNNEKQLVVNAKPVLVIHEYSKFMQIIVNFSFRCHVW